MSERRVLITGGAKRIGAAIARRLAAEGWHVLVHYNASAEEAEALAAEIGGAAIQADLGRRDDIEALIGRCVAAYGPLDALVNNASTFAFDSIDTLEWDFFEHNWIVNGAAPIFLARDFARQVVEGRDATVLNILDQKMANLNPDFFSYTVGKIALTGASKLLAMAWVSRIRVNAIAPGITLRSGKQTDAGFERAWKAAPLGRSSTPEEIAACASFLLSTPSVQGQTVIMDGGEHIAGRARDVAFDTGALDTGAIGLGDG